VLCGCSAPDQRIIDDSGKGIPSAHVKEVIDLLAERLTDPLSIQIRKLRQASKNQKWDPPHTIYCGEVNGKNRMGGYVGFVPFSVEFDTKVVFISNPDTLDWTRHVLQDDGCL
jgi:hypothetical protein